MTASWRGDKGTAQERGYGWAWQKARDAYLAQRPLCAMCAALSPPRLSAATVVDHIQPHRGDPVLFWDQDNWQGLCTSCHISRKQRLERSGHVQPQIGDDGFPLP